jgi:uncharacterized protein
MSEIRQIQLVETKVGVLKNLIIEMFITIDSSKFKEITSFFDQNVIYERPGFEKIYGLEDLLNFYSNIRKIEGKHEIESILIDHDKACVVGNFVGRDKDGNSINQAFSDHYKISNNKIIYRKTFFFKPAI